MQLNAMQGCSTSAAGAPRGKQRRLTKRVTGLQDGGQRRLQAVNQNARNPRPMDSVSILPATPGTLRLKILMTPVGLAAGLTLFALALRLIGLGSRPFWLDEAFSA